MHLNYHVNQSKVFHDTLFPNCGVISFNAYNNLKKVEFHDTFAFDERSYACGVIVTNL